MDGDIPKSELDESLSKVSDAIRLACGKQFGVLDSAFLCQSLSVLNPKQPETVGLGTPLREVVSRLQGKGIGCVLVLDQQQKMVGIFSERDFLLKTVSMSGDNDPSIDWSAPIEQFMTPDPIGEMPATTVAFALTLMASGGFRHLPLIDQDGVPVGIISVKDIIEFIVETVHQDLSRL